MGRLEEMMAGLFGDTMAPGADDPRRRGRGGEGGIGGAQVMPGAMLPYLMNQRNYDFSGAMGGQFGGREGLMSLLAQQGGGRNPSGPAMSHFQNQGFDFNPPGLNNQNQLGGPNIAPGNIDNARALDQPQGNPTPGVPQGVARGFGAAPGQMSPSPQRTQGWRNLQGGFSAAAGLGYGTPQFGRNVAQEAGLAGPGGGRTDPAQAGGGGGGAGAPPVARSQNPIGGGGQAVAPAGPGGGGGGSVGGGQASGRGGRGGGGAGGSVAAMAAGARPTGQPGVNAPVARQQAADTRAAGNIALGAGGKNLGGSPLLDALGAIQDRGNAGTSRGGKGIGGPARGAAHERMKEQGKMAGLSAKQKASRKTAWQNRVDNRQEATAARQEAARVARAPSASQFGSNSATNDRGTGLAPLPKAGKTKPKPRSTSAQQR
jgi:hypothetical protein